MLRYLLLAAPFFLFACGGPGETARAAGSSNGTTAIPEAVGPARIEIQTTGIPAGRALLIGMYAGQQYRADSADVDDKGFVAFERDEPYTQGYYFAALPGQKSLPMLIDQDQEFSFVFNAADPLTTTVKGSKANELYYENLRYEQTLQPRRQEISQRIQGAPEGTPAHAAAIKEMEEFNTANEAALQKTFQENPDNFYVKFKSAGQNPTVRNIRLPNGQPDQEAQLVAYREDFWNNVDFNDERLIRTPVISNKLRRYLEEITVKHPDSLRRAIDLLMRQVPPGSEYFKYFANKITLDYEPTKTDLMDAEAIYVYMIQNYFTNERAFWSDSSEVMALQLRAKEMSQSLVGLKGPDVVSTDPQGNKRSIYEMKAPYIVVFMYNPDCSHCIEETPKLVKFYKEWKSKGVDIFAIAIDTDRDPWTNFIAKNGMTFTNVFDASNKSIYGKYYVDNTPEIYVLGPDRMIIAKNLKVNQIETVITRDMAKRGE